MGPDSWRTATALPQDICFAWTKINHKPLSSCGTGQLGIILVSENMVQKWERERHKGSHAGEKVHLKR